MNHWHTELTHVKRSSVQVAWLVEEVIFLRWNDILMSDYMCYSTALLNQLSHPPPLSLTYQAFTPQVNDYWQTETDYQAAHFFCVGGIYLPSSHLHSGHWFPQWSAPDVPRHQSFWERGGKRTKQVLALYLGSWGTGIWYCTCIYITKQMLVGSLKEKHPQ